MKMLYNNNFKDDRLEIHTTQSLSSMRCLPQFYIDRVVHENSGEYRHLVTARVIHMMSLKMLHRYQPRSQGLRQPPSAVTREDPGTEVASL